MPWTPLNFGRHNGKTLPQLLFTDPDYFFWAYETEVFEGRGEPLRGEAERIHAKATSIRIPQTGTEPLQVEYKFDHTNNSLSWFEIVEESRAPHTGATITLRGEFIDMSILRRQRGYDKGGYKNFIHARPMKAGNRAAPH